MRNTKRAKLAEWVEREKPLQIGSAEFARLLEDLAPISENYLRKLLKDSGAALAPLIEGVRQSSLEDLERTLRALLTEYEAGDPAHRQMVRKLVITAKDHAKWTHKDEHVLWMTTWLENPPLFPAWAGLRRPRYDAK